MLARVLLLVHLVRLLITHKTCRLSSLYMLRQNWNRREMQGWMREAGMQLSQQRVKA